jgi:capsular exopolysaccharide synthesis family protein
MERIYSFLQRADRLSPPVHRAPGEPLPNKTLPASGNADFTPDSPDSASDIASLFTIVQKHWRTVAASALLLGALSLLATYLMKPLYEPEARLDVDPPGFEQFALEPQVASSDTEYLQTQVQNLQSEALALAVIRSLHLAGNGTEQKQPATIAPDDGQRLTPTENAALREFKGRLKIDHDPGSRVITISVGAHDPVQAAARTNTLAHLYVDRMAAARQQAITQSVDWLSQQVKDIRKRMDDSNRALVEFQQANKVADVDEGKSTFGEMLADLSKQRTQTAADRIQLEALLNRVHNGNADSLPQVHASLLIQQLTQKLAEVRGELAQSRAIYGPNHPHVKRLENQRDELEKELDQQKQGILQELKSSYAATQAREQLVSHAVDAMNRQMTLVAEYSALKREAQANTELYNSLYSKVEEAAISAASKSSNIRILDQARVLDRPTKPRRLLNLVLGLAGGFVFGIVGAFIREGLDQSVRTIADVQQFDSNLPVSIVPLIEAARTGRFPRMQGFNGGNALEGYEPLLLSRPRSPEAEAVRSLRTSLILSQLNGPPQVLLIVSSLPAEGKTTLAVNLAVALAQHGPTCVIDCDWRRSSLSYAFRRDSKPGLGEVLSGRSSLRDAVAQTHISGLHVLTSGHATEDVYEFGGRSAMSDTLAALRQHFKFIIVDAPPILPYSDARVLSTMVDGVVFVGRSRITKRDAMKRALEVLAQVRSAPIVEVVLNGADKADADYGYYQYGYKS